MESQAWRKAETEATADAIRAFIVSHPESADAPEAKRKLAALEAGSAKKNQEKEDAAWAMAEQSGKQPALEAFLKAYPDGGHAGKAKAVLEELAAKKPGSKQDEEAWAKAKAQNTRQAYQGYLKAYPKGPHAEAARQKLKTAETGKKDADNATASAEPEKRPARTGSDGGARWPF
jgi:outer membrane protein assembly factor BamD (BamD/ComL family)